jgi:hypothetical protein
MCRKLCAALHDRFGADSLMVHSGNPQCCSGLGSLLESGENFGDNNGDLELFKLVCKAA